MENTFNFTVNNDSDEDIVIRTGAAIEPFNYLGTVYRALSTNAFCDLVIARKTDFTVAGYHDKGFSAILNDSITDAERDKVTYLFEDSLQMEEWNAVLDDSLSQKQLINFLKCRRQDIPEVPEYETLLYNLQNFKFVQNIEADYSQTDNNNYTFAFKSRDGEGTVKLPQQFAANIELIKGSNYIQEIEIELEIHRPKSADEKPTFVLHCPKMRRYQEIAKDHEIDKLINALNGQDLVLVNAYV